MIKRTTTTVVCPFTIYVDAREQLPYTFTGMVADARQGHLPILVNVDRRTLKTGDYSVSGLEDVATVERKTLADLYSTLSQGRDRFAREHERMVEMQAAVVVIEADWSEIILNPPSHSKLNPKTVFRTCCSWSARYNVPWMAMGSRRLAEVFTFRFLEKAWEQYVR